MLKYKKEIGLVCEMGIKCPPDNIYPMIGKMYRFLHTEDCDFVKNNNLPNKSIIPHRGLDDNVKCIGYAALSCFETIDGAIRKYRDITTSVKQFYKTAGCHLGEFSVIEEDGFRTKADLNYTHFSFFEKEECNFNDVKKYILVTKLVNECGI